ncbi:hypothetical protein RRX38_07735 [Pseudomonas sp. DTU_2021_1001937_2_SI_NGA_ILE_001]|uniref:hypothetical protein n=1 Tax=Pseudomonas sp. DTU_2021_1001937_2_SI_NGA_ILE_001 TaxID=3077589 RepID=UPI0025FA2D6B|nr:hypothetical protein [Pseudomonas sp. DTU_2021_1001937_2_SI_NGA_ILE_001]WNW11047.1 hypothetical protein RRX38_07735 [Pseudomonas sp. DTU_2021_1001937_2_SI_NGA_ILE_001]
MATPQYGASGGDDRTTGAPLEDHFDDTPSTGSEADGLAQYVDELAQSIAQLADDLRGQNADQALQQAGNLARDNPAKLLLASLALGFGLSRVFAGDRQADPFAQAEPSNFGVAPAPGLNGHPDEAAQGMQGA